MRTMLQTWHIVEHHCTSPLGTLDKNQANTWGLFDNYTVFSFQFAGDTRAKAEPPRCAVAAIAVGHRAEGEQLGGIEQSC